MFRTRGFWDARFRKLSATTKPDNNKNINNINNYMLEMDVPSNCHLGEHNHDVPYNDYRESELLDISVDDDTDPVSEQVKNVHHQRIMTRLERNIRSDAISEAPE